MLILHIVVPCYNEEAVLPITAKKLRDKIENLSCWMAHWTGGNWLGGHHMFYLGYWQSFADCYRRCKEYIGKVTCKQRDAPLFIISEVIGLEDGH